MARALSVGRRHGRRLDAYWACNGSLTEHECGRPTQGPCSAQRAWGVGLSLSRFKLLGPPTPRDTEASNAYAVIHDSLGPVSICSIIGINSFDEGPQRGPLTRGKGLKAL